MKFQIIVLGLLTASSLQAALAPGQAHRIAWPGTEHGFIRISVPEAAREGQPLPVLFWFHGTGGQPSIIFGHGNQYGITKDQGRYALDDSYKEKFQYVRDHLIVVGMSYPNREPGAPPFPIQRLWETCRSVRDWLHPQVAVDKSRCYMGGFSRGGTNSFLSSVRPPPDLAGVAMFAGGVPSGFKFDAKERYGRPYHVLLGLGEWDSNFWSGHMARRFFRARGATVTYDEWLNGGHGSIEMSRRVLDWFELRIREKDPSYPSEVTRTMLEAYKDATTQLKGWQRFLALREMLGDPRLANADPRMRQQIVSGMKALSAVTVVARPYQEFQAWNALVNQEIDLFHYGNVTEQALLHLLHTYQGFADRYPNGVCYRNALQARVRVMHYLEIGMFNSSELARSYDDPESSPAPSTAREQLQTRLAALEQQLKEAEHQRVNRGAPRETGRDTITHRIPSLDGGTSSSALKLQIQHLRSQLASLPGSTAGFTARKIPPPPRHYDSLTPDDEAAAKDALKKEIERHPIDRFSLRSGPGL
ncbi:MAG: putative esterase [Candidatus Omnitrophota bacterium]